VETSPEQLWSQVLERLQLQLSRPTFETWIKTASAEKLDNNCLVIRTPNPFAKIGCRSTISKRSLMLYKIF
jgi:chromosomal replication initiator protein